MCSTPSVAGHTQKSTRIQPVRHASIAAALIHADPFARAPSSMPLQNAPAIRSLLTLRATLLRAGQSLAPGLAASSTSSSSRDHRRPLSCRREVANVLQLRRKALMVHIDADADHRIAQHRRRGRLRGHRGGLHQNRRRTFVRQAEDRSASEYPLCSPVTAAIAACAAKPVASDSHSASQHRHRRPQQHAHIQPIAGSRVPAMPTSPATRRLLIGHPDASMRSARLRRLQRQQIRRPDRSEDAAPAPRTTVSASAASTRS